MVPLSRIQLTVLPKYGKIYSARKYLFAGKIEGFYYSHFAQKVYAQAMLKAKVDKMSSIDFES
jgi:hypothetical protein